MSQLKLEHFFGLKIEDERSDIMPILRELGIDQDVENSKVVKALKKANGHEAPIVSVARRQQALKAVLHLLNAPMLEYDPLYYTKEINTSSDHDRKYGAEEKLLEFALVVASTKSPKMMRDDPKVLTTKQLREAAFKETRFERCWEILAEETSHIVNAFRKAKKS